MWQTGGVGLMLVLAIACATGPGTGRVAAASPVSGLTLQVTNRALDDLQLFLVRGGGIVIPIGSVAAHTSRVITISPSELSAGEAVQLVAGRRSGAPIYRSAVFTVSAGQGVEWVIDPTSRTGFVVIR